MAKADIDRAFEGLGKTGAIVVKHVSPGQTIPKVGGLEVFGGLSCTKCYYFGRHPTSMRTHNSKFHKESDKEEWPATLIQGQNHTGQVTYFGVHDLADEVSLAGEEVWLAAKHDVEGRRGKSLSDPLVEDERFQGQLERAMRWSAEIKGKDTIAISNLVDSPNSELFPLHSICNKMLTTINESLRTGDRILRRKLIGYLLKQKSTNFRKPSKLFNPVGQTTVDKYASVFLRLVCFCIRSHLQPEIWDVPFNMSEAKSIESLYYALNHKDQHANIENLVRELVLILIKTFRYETFRGQIQCPLWRFLISSSILHSGGFADAEAVSHTCAALKFCWRAILFEESIRLMDLDYKAHTTTFDSEFRQCIEPGNRTSWDSIKDAMDCAKSVLQHKTTLSGFEWVEGTERREMIMDGKSLSLSGISTAVTVGLNAAMKHMIDNVLDELNPYIVPRVVPVDQRRVSHQQCPNYSFITDRNNPYVDFRHTLLRHLVARGKLGRFWNGKFEWDTRACERFLEQSDILREMMYVLIHFQYGAVGRASEGGTLTWCNDGWRPGSLKYAHEMLMLLATYNKTNALTGTDKPIARYISL